MTAAGGTLGRDEQNKHVEFKQSARWSRTSKDPRIHKNLAEGIIAKTVAGFLNGQGGTLLIGVNDDGDPVGLNSDYRHVRPGNADGFVNWLDTMLENALGHAGAHRVSIRIDVIGGVEVCRVDVPASSKPIWATFKKQDAELFERRNNSTRRVPPEERDDFIATRFGTSDVTTLRTYDEWSGSRAAEPGATYRVEPTDGD